MLGKKYFRDRLSDIYDYSLIQYLSGNGNLKSNNQNIQVDWELCVDLSGEIIFVVSNSRSRSLFYNSNETFNLSGKTLDGEWEIESNDILLYGVTSNSLGDFSFCAISDINLKHKNFSLNSITHSISYISNYDLFYGKEIYPLRANKNVDFEKIDKNKEIKDLIDIKRINSAILSKMKLYITNQDLEDNLVEVESITWFLSLVSLNYCFESIVEIHNSSEKVFIKIYNGNKSNYRQDRLINDRQINNGTHEFFSKSYANFIGLNKDLNIRIFIEYLIKIENEPTTEIKIAILVLTYEYLLTGYLMNKGDITDPEGINIEQKISKINKYVRFIPKPLLDKFFRDSIRNPLFHQGIILSLSHDERIKYLKIYSDLIIKIFLVLLGYEEEYMSRVDYKSRKVKDCSYIVL